MNYYTIATIIRSITYDCCNCKMSLAPSIQVRAKVHNRPSNYHRPSNYPHYMSFCATCFKHLMEQANVYVVTRRHIDLMAEIYDSTDNTRLY